MTSLAIQPTTPLPQKGDRRRRIGEYRPSVSEQADAAERFHDYRIEYRRARTDGQLVPRSTFAVDGERYVKYAQLTVFPADRLFVVYLYANPRVAHLDYALDDIEKIRAGHWADYPWAAPEDGSRYWVHLGYSAATPDHVLGGRIEVCTEARCDDYRSVRHVSGDVPLEHNAYPVSADRPWSVSATRFEGEEWRVTISADGDAFTPADLVDFRQDLAWVTAEVAKWNTADGRTAAPETQEVPC